MLLFAGGILIPLAIRSAVRGDEYQGIGGKRENEEKKKNLRQKEPFKRM